MKKAQPKIKKLLGFQGKNIKTGGYAAIKVIKVESTDDFQQIEQEITMLKSCQHRNIIRYEMKKFRRSSKQK